MKNVNKRANAITKNGQNIAHHKTTKTEKTNFRQNIFNF
jgi:hypothetical protein